MVLFKGYVWIVQASVLGSDERAWVRSNDIFPSKLSSVPECMYRSRISTDGLLGRVEGLVSKSQSVQTESCYLKATSNTRNFLAPVSLANLNKTKGKGRGRHAL